MSQLATILLACAAPVAFFSRATEAAKAKNVTAHLGNLGDGQIHPTWLTSQEGVFAEYFPGVHFQFYWTFMVLLTTAYILLKMVFSHKRMPRFLKNDAGLASYTLLSGAVITVLAYVGVVGIWKHSGRPEWATPLQRLFNNTPEGDMVAQIHASYQVWNFAMAIVRRDGWVSFWHHLFCAYMGMLNSAGFGCFHLMWMGGVMELSTVILTVMQVFKDNPYLQKDFPFTYLITRQLFCVVFLALRVAFWFVVLYWFFSDMFVYLRDGPGQKFRWHCYVNIVGMLILTVIQLIWARLVLLGVLKFLGFFANTDTSSEYEYEEKNSSGSSVSTECGQSVSTEQPSPDLKPQTKKQK